LAALNDDVLAVLGVSAAAPAPLAAHWETDRSLDALRTRAGRLWTATMSSAPTVWDDDRNSITLPFWRTVITSPVAAVLVYGDPSEVAHSLAAGAGVTVTYGLARWDRYLRAACAALVGLPTLVTPDDIWPGEPSVDELVAFLGSIGADGDDPEAVTATAAITGADGGSPPPPSAAGWPAPAPAPGDSLGAVVAVLDGQRGFHRAWTAPDLGPAPPWVDDVLTLRRAVDTTARRLTEARRLSAASVAFRVTRALGRLGRRGRTTAS
jgi:hypothetical protein